MTPADIVLLGIIAFAVGGAIYYVYKEKKAGKRCIGCPHSGTCSGGCSCSNEKKADRSDL